MYKMWSLLVGVTILVVIPGCASKKFSEGVELSIKSKDYESSRAKFKFYDASEGCPSYLDGPWASAYIGSAKVSATATTMNLPRNKKIHVFYFTPRETHELMAKGGAKEVRRRSAQIVLFGGEAELQLIKDKDNNNTMKWIEEGAIQLESATKCSQK